MSDTLHRGGRLRWWLVGLVIVLVVAVLASILVTRDGGVRAALPGASPTAQPEPSRGPLFPAAGDSAPVPTADGLRRALATALKNPGLGRRVGLSVLDASSGAVVLEVGASQPVTPASTAKIATAVAALTALPADQRFQTRVLQGAPGEVVLVGGGDPTLAGRYATKGAFPQPARLAALAAQLKGIAVRRVLVDDTLFPGPRTGPGWKPGYVSTGDVAPVSALTVDGGRMSSSKHQGRAADPALETGRQFAALLGVKNVTRGVAPQGATQLATVSSPTVAALVEAMLVRSDNDLAEALGRHVALAAGKPATFVGEASATAAALGPLLDRVKVGRGALLLADASGLSPLNRLQPAALTRLLALVGRDARYAPILTGLPVAGFDGTLGARYRAGPTTTAAGVVRAKTGTLNGVSALAGLVRTKDGRLLAFDATADGVAIGGNSAAQAALDRVAAVLAGCGCH